MNKAETILIKNLRKNGCYNVQSEQLCIKCKKAPANRGLGEHRLVCSDCWNSLCD